MYEYTLKETLFSAFGITESQITGGNVALEGAWDMPARIGKIFHDWGDEDGIEPYLRADEIFFGGRDIKFSGFMKASSREDALERLDSFFNHLSSSDLMELKGELGTWHVYVSSEITVEYFYGDDIAVIEFTFREPIVSFVDVMLPVPDHIGERIDDISWQSLGVTFLTLTEDLNRPSLKSQVVTAYGVERYEGSKRSFRELDFKGIIVQKSYADFKTVLNRLYKLFKMPNARTLKMHDTTVREVFVKDGFKITNVTIEENEVIAEIAITFCEIRQLQNWNNLTDITGLILVDQYGQPLSEIAKKFQLWDKEQKT